MSKRAPAGSRAIAAQVSRLVADVGVKTAANILGKSQSAVRTVDKAFRAGRVSDAWKTDKGLNNWTRATGRASTYASPEVRKVMSGAQAPAGFTRASSRAERSAQDRMSALHAQYRDKDIAKAMGVSRQQVTAWRLKAARGDVPPGLGTKLAAAKDNLDRRGPRLEGGLKVYDDPSRVPDGAVSRNKYLTLKEAQKWIANVEGGSPNNPEGNPKNYFRLVKRGEQDEDGNELYDIVYMPEEARADEREALEDGEDPLDYADLEDEADE